jgi:hypothetical protein
MTELKLLEVAHCIALHFDFIPRRGDEEPQQILKRINRPLVKLQDVIFLMEKYAGFDADGIVSKLTKIIRDYR